MISGLLIGIVLPVRNCWFHKMVTLLSWLVSTDFGTWKNQCLLSNFTPISLHALNCRWAHIISCPFMYCFLPLLDMLIWRVPLSLHTDSIFCLFLFVTFLGAFAKLRKATISFVMSVRLSVRPHRTARLPLEGFSRNLVSVYFSKICRKNWSFVKIWQK